MHELCKIAGVMPEPRPIPRKHLTVNEKYFCIRTNALIIINMLLPERKWLGGKQNDFRRRLCKFTFGYFRITFPFSKNIFKPAPFYHTVDKSIIASSHHGPMPDEICGRKRLDVRR